MASKISKKAEAAGGLTRRVFLKKTVATAGAVFGVPILVPSSVIGSNGPSNRINIGCIGMGGQGTWDMNGFMQHGDVQIVAVCDVNKRSDDYDMLYQFPHSTAGREPARELVERYYGQNRASGSYKGCDSYGDFRQLLAREDIDAVIVTTPDHWHVPISLAAVRAGKDVYCEKPLSLSISEGRVLCEAVKRYNRVFQTGSQQRSESKFRFVCELVRNGRIGRLHTIRVGIPGNNCENPQLWQAMAVPEGFDYDMWLGPAPWAPYTKQRCHYRFRFMLDYSGGQITNFGAHDFDIAQWANGSDRSGPIEVEDLGSEFPRDGLFTTATKVNVAYKYANGVKMYCTTGTSGIRFEGSDGWIYVNRDQLEAEPKSILESTIGRDEVHLYRSVDQMRNFLDCVKSRCEPVAGVEVGHGSATVCHLANIAIQVGGKLRWDPVKERFIDNDAANRMVSRTGRTGWQV